MSHHAKFNPDGFRSFVPDSMKDQAQDIARAASDSGAALNLQWLDMLAVREDVRPLLELWQISESLSRDIWKELLT